MQGTSQDLTFSLTLVRQVLCTFLIYRVRMRTVHKVFALVANRALLSGSWFSSTVPFTRALQPHCSLCCSSVGWAHSLHRALALAIPSPWNSLLSHTPVTCALLPSDLCSNTSPQRPSLIPLLTAVLVMLCSFILPCFSL